MKNNRGGATGAFLLFCCFISIFLLFVGILICQILYGGVFHSLRNDLYIINRNVLLSLQRQEMAEDVFSVYKNSEQRAREEIERLWNIDVSYVSEKGIIRKVDILSSVVKCSSKDLEICTKLRISLNAIMFKKAVGDYFTFDVEEKTNISKLRGFE